MTYVTAETVFGVWLFMGPLLGGGLLGLKLRAMFPVISLVRHRAYGAALATLYPLEVPEESKEAANLPELQPV